MCRNIDMQPARIDPFAVNSFSSASMDFTDPEATHKEGLIASSDGNAFYIQSNYFLLSKAER